MSDFDLLLALQKELTDTLKARARLVSVWIPCNLSKAKIRRRRLQIQEVMLRIERACEGSYISNKEAWHK